MKHSKVHMFIFLTHRPHGLEDLKKRIREEMVATPSLYSEMWLKSSENGFNRVLMMMAATWLHHFQNLKKTSLPTK